MCSSCTLSSVLCPEILLLLARWYNLRQIKDQSHGSHHVLIIEIMVIVHPFNDNDRKKFGVAGTGFDMTMSYGEMRGSFC